jgi:hypothetical protein
MKRYRISSKQDFDYGKYPLYRISKITVGDWFLKRLILKFHSDEFDEIKGAEDPEDDDY